MGVDIDGLDSLRSKLAELGSRVATGAEKGTEAAAELLAGEIADDAPVKTGALRDSVHAEGPTVIIGSGLDRRYAAIVEDRQPFVQPAVNRNRGNVVDAVADAIKDELA